ncbi:MAG: hypothetical protein P4L36_02720 [Holophaga sp.]|nr:hypothetical protein [Holophaga sp.]
MGIMDLATRAALLAMLGLIYAAFLCFTVSGRAVRDGAAGRLQDGSLQPGPGLFPGGRSSG